MGHKSTDIQRASLSNEGEHKNIQVPASFSPQSLGNVQSSKTEYALAWIHKRLIILGLIVNHIIIAPQPIVYVNIPQQKAGLVD